MPAMVMLSSEQRTRGQARISRRRLWWQGGPRGRWGHVGSRVGAGMAAAATRVSPETVAGYLRWLGWLSGWLAGRGLALRCADWRAGGAVRPVVAGLATRGRPPRRLATMLGYLREAEPCRRRMPAPPQGGPVSVLADRDAQGGTWLGHCRRPAALAGMFLRRARR